MGRHPAIAVLGLLLALSVTPLRAHEASERVDVLDPQATIAYSQAAIGRRQLRHIDAFNQGARRNGEILTVYFRSASSRAVSWFPTASAVRASCTRVLVHPSWIADSSWAMPRIPATTSRLALSPIKRPFVS